MLHLFTTFSISSEFLSLFFLFFSSPFPFLPLPSPLSSVLFPYFHSLITCSHIPLCLSFRSFPPYIHLPHPPFSLLYLHAYLTYSPTPFSFTWSLSLLPSLSPSSLLPLAPLTLPPPLPSLPTLFMRGPSAVHELLKHPSTYSLVSEPKNKVFSCHPVVLDLSCTWVYAVR